jgi:hypothetical protein
MWDVYFVKKKRKEKKRKEKNSGGATLSTSFYKFMPSPFHFSYPMTPKS